MHKNLVLVGLRGTGKSTVARLVARQLGWESADVDPVIEARAGKSIRAIFDEDGESAFRKLEAEVTRELLGMKDLVLAAGGGVVVRKDNREALREHDVVWLAASPEILYERIHGDPSTSARRPDLTAFGGLAEIRELAERRDALYREVSRWRVDTEGKTPDQVASEIVSLLESDQ